MGINAGSLLAGSPSVSAATATGGDSEEQTEREGGKRTVRTGLDSGKRHCTCKDVLQKQSFRGVGNSMRSFINGFHDAIYIHCNGNSAERLLRIYAGESR